MTSISDINKSEHAKIALLRDVKVKSISDTRFVKTKFDKKKDEEKGGDHTTGVRDITIVDDSGEIVYVEWSPKDDLKVGDELEFINAHVVADEYDGETRYRLNISKKKNSALVLNRTALSESRPAGKYIRKGGGNGGGSSGVGSVDLKPVLEKIAGLDATLTNLVEAIANMDEKFTGEIASNHAALMTQIQEAMKKIQGKASKKEE